MSKRHNILRTKTSFFFQVQEKLKSGRNCCFISDDSHVNIVWLNVAVLTDHDILHFFEYPFIEILPTEGTSKLL